ncbi:MAG TPA: RMD1 family protein, partial [Polyangia bacterium]|nr:RMD1 family protein [Polyangia bacterium]
TIAQSAAMEYYERIVDQMFTETDRLVDRLEKVGTMPVFTRKLHKFIGAAIGTRSEVLSVLHLFDKPDAAWDDPVAEKIYEELRAEFDLVDRHNALELKLRSVQDALELVTDIARDKRLVWLEVSIVLLIVLEIALRFVGH